MLADLAKVLRSWGQSNKSRIRAVTRRLGYDVQRFRTSEFEHLQSLLTRHGIDYLIDVGANEGQYAQKMRATGFSGPVVSFEPGKDAFSRLQAHSCHDRSWTVRKLALGAASGVADLNLSGNSVSSSLLAMEDRHAAAAPESSYVGVEQVAISTLDAEVGEAGSRLWLKVDVQGGELSVLEGASQTLTRVSVVELELSLVPLYVGQPTMTSLVDYLSQRGFTLVALVPGLQDPASGDLLQVDGIFARPSETSRIGVNRRATASEP